MKFDFYSDPSHGWLKVSRKHLNSTGCQSRITSCSYQRGKWVYLEEDCDAPLFIKEFRRVIGKPVDFRSHHTNRQSRLRNYESYSPDESQEGCIPKDAFAGIKVTE